MQDQEIAQLREDVSQGRLSLGDITKSANQYIAENRIDLAYPLVCVITETPQVAPDTLLTAGLLALSLGREDDAEAFFERVVEKEAGHFDANYNLFLLYLNQGKTEAAQRRLDILIETYPDNASLYSDMAVMLASAGETDKALDYWRKALSIDPNLALARDNALQACLEKGMIEEGKHVLLLNARAAGVTSKSVKEIEAWAGRLAGAVGQPEVTQRKAATISPIENGIRNKKIAVFAAFDTFLKDIAGHLAKENEVRTFRKGTAERMRLLLEWADVAWFEWCDSYLVEATRMPKICPIVCRLHSYEAFSEVPSMVDWTKVDLLIFVNDSVKQVLEKRLPIPTPQITIHNAVDGSRFTIPDGKVYGKKIASVGYINYRKNPGLLLYCFKKIHQYDPEYSLHIAGEHQSPRLELYFEHFLKENPLPIYFDGWVEDMPAWYADKDYVISTSLFESFHYSIAEGMACGLTPLIHNWFGADKLYPGEFLFIDPDECLEIVKSLGDRDRAALGRQNRQFILERYSPDDKMAALSAQLKRLAESGVTTGQTTA